MSEIRIKKIMLAGDIGGTNTRLAAFSNAGGRLVQVAGAVYPSRDYKNLEEVLAVFLKCFPVKVGAAAFGVAGPVLNGRSGITNLPWTVDSLSLAAALRLPAVGLINDLVANAYGIAALTGKETAVLRRGGTGSAGNRVLLSAGTGLGVAHLYWDGAAHRPSASEGGHAGFAPEGALQAELLSYLQPQFRHVSWERVLSGPGLLNIYRFLKAAKRGKEPAWLAAELRKPDPAAVISKRALDGSSALCSRALDLFAGIYGSMAGNAALGVWATGGVYLGGGIAPKILSRLKTGSFMKAFLAKGRLGADLAKMPVKIILSDKTALLGAALYASLAASEGKNAAWR